jgi:hypothetical protein
LERKRVGEDFKASHPEQDRARLAFKKFTTFKNSFDLKDGFKMYVAKLHVPPKKKELEKTESKRERVKATASGRSTRKISNDEAKPRTANDSRKPALALKKAHPIVTLNVGDLSASVRRATINPGFEGKLLTTIPSLVRIMSAAKRLVQLATDLLLMYVMEYFPYRDFLSNQARSRIFTPLLYGKDGGKVYQQNLLRLVISGQKESVDIDKFIDGLVHSNQESHQVEGGVNTVKYQAMIAYNLLKKCYPNNQDYQSLDELYGRLSVSRPLEMLSQVIDTELASHIKGRLPLLQANVTS